MEGPSKPQLAVGHLAGGLLGPRVVEGHFLPQSSGVRMSSQTLQTFFDILGSIIGPKNVLKMLEKCPRVWGALDKMSDLHLGVVGPPRKM